MRSGPGVKSALKTVRMPKPSPRACPASPGGYVRFMKKCIALICGLAGATWSMGHGATDQPPATPPPAAVKKPEAKKPEPEPVIDGIVLSRANGGFLGITLDNGTFKIAFYDKKKKPVAADVTRALARWNPKSTVNAERTDLSPLADGKALGGGKFVRPPYAFKLFLSLMQGDGDDAQVAESYVVDFHD